MKRVYLLGKFKSTNGMSLAVVLMASAMFGLLVLAVTKFLENANKAQTGITIRAEAQDFTNLLRFALAKPDSCKSILALTDPKVNLTFIPPTDAKPDKKTLSVPKMVVSNSDITKDSPIMGRNLIMADMFLIIDQEITPGTASFPAELKLLLDVTQGSKRVAGATRHVQTIPIGLETEKIDPSDTSPDAPVKIIGCAALNNDFKPKESCLALGGKWLDGEYMGYMKDGVFISTARCAFGSQIPLTTTEGPSFLDVNPNDGKINTKAFDGGVTKDGERVEQCIYTAKNGISAKTYVCPLKYGDRAGYRCRYNRSLRQWEVRYYNNKTDAFTVLNTVCTKGVIVSSKSPDQDSLAWNEPLSQAFGPDDDFSDRDADTGASYQEVDRLPTLTLCHFEPDADSSFACVNTTNPDAAIRNGAGNVCAWVTGQKIPAGDNNVRWKRIWKYNGCYDTSSSPNNTNCNSPINALNYTGWAAVIPGDSSYLRSYAITGPLGQRKAGIREALVAPCFDVDVNLAVETTALDKVDSDPPLQADFADPSRIRQCVHEAAQFGTYMSASPTPKKRSYFNCQNPTADQITDAFASGEHPLTLFRTNSCWYVVNGKISTYTAKSTPILPQTYTGWIYLTADWPKSLKGVSTSTSTYNYYIPALGGLNAGNNVVHVDGSSYFMDGSKVTDWGEQPVSFPEGGTSTDYAIFSNNNAALSAPSALSARPCNVGIRRGSTSSSP